MTTLTWDAVPADAPTAPSSLATPWFGICMGLLGIIIGFTLHRTFVPVSLGAQDTPPPAPIVQAVVPSPTKPVAPSVGAGCGCGGGGGAGCGVVAPLPTT